MVEERGMSRDGQDRAAPSMVGRHPPVRSTRDHRVDGAERAALHRGPGHHRPPAWRQDRRGVGDRRQRVHRRAA